jgi:hypothetical protein
MEGKVHDWAKTQPVEFDFEHLDQLISDLIEKEQSH